MGSLWSSSKQKSISYYDGESFDDAMMDLGNGDMSMFKYLKFHSSTHRTAIMHLEQNNNRSRVKFFENEDSLHLAFYDIAKNLYVPQTLRTDSDLPHIITFQTVKSRLITFDDSPLKTLNTDKAAHGAPSAMEWFSNTIEIKGDGFIISGIFFNEQQSKILFNHIIENFLRQDKNECDSP